MKSGKLRIPGLLTLGLTLLLGGCGVQGDLMTPPPMWGKEDPGKAAETLPDDQVQEQTRDGLIKIEEKKKAPETETNTPDGG